MDVYDNEPVYSKNVIEMLTVANEYCIFIENIEKYNLDDVFAYFMKITPLLYLKGALLPDIVISNEEANERFITEETYLTIYKTLEDKFEDFNLYKDADNVSMNDSELCEYNLAENLTDVYQDFKDFILLYQKESLAAKENAVYACKYLFETHWGFRIIAVLKVMHFRQFNELK